jgi:hypothetical protein
LLNGQLLVQVLCRNLGVQQASWGGQRPYCFFFHCMKKIPSLHLTFPSASAFLVPYPFCCFAAKLLRRWLCFLQSLSFSPLITSFSHLHRPTLPSLRKTIKVKVKVTPPHILGLSQAATLPSWCSFQSQRHSWFSFCHIGCCFSASADFFLCYRISGCWSTTGPLPFLIPWWICLCHGWKFLSTDNPQRCVYWRPRFRALDTHVHHPQPLFILDHKCPATV